MPHKPLTTVNDVFGCWDTMHKMADDVGITHWAAQKWSQRSRIPPSSWGTVCEALKRKGKKLSVEQLLAMHGSTLPKRASGARACR